MGYNRLQIRWKVLYNSYRSDNSVKNHFYSMLRKSLRKINKVIQDEFCKYYKELKPNVLYRVV